MSIFVVRAFIRLRELISTHKVLAAKLEELERKVSGHDKALGDLVATIRNLMTQRAPRRRGIGFTADLEGR